ncbi:MAG: hypothetical protein Q9163_003788 [Psora crenata]
MEYQTMYADGYVETYVAVPVLPTPFCIHLESNGYIAPGLAMFVYIDGVYQCNRNRHNLKGPGEVNSRMQTEVNFKVRQQEEWMSDGTFEGKQWRFERVKTGMADPPRSYRACRSDAVQQALVPSMDKSELTPYAGEYVGTIEVVVLRCYSSDALKPTTHTATAAAERKASDEEEIPYLTGAMFDGANDPKPGFLGLSIPSELSSSSDSRPSGQRHGRDKIEIRNSNVNIFRTDGKGQKTTRTSHGRHGKTHPKALSDRFDSGRISPRAHMRSRQGDPSHQRKIPPNAPDPPILNLRGRAPGSYTVSPSADGWNGDTVPVRKSGKAQDRDNKMSSFEDVPALGLGATENKDWQPNPDDWGAPSGEVKPTPWDFQERDPWGAPINEPGICNSGATPAWDAGENSFQKRDQRAQCVTDEAGNTSTGATRWEAPVAENDKQCFGCTSSNEKPWGNGGTGQLDRASTRAGAKAGDQQQIPDKKANYKNGNRQSPTWGANTAGSNEQGSGWNNNNHQGTKKGDAHNLGNGNKQSKRHGSLKANQANPTVRAFMPVEGDNLENSESIGFKLDTKPWPSSVNNTAKASKPTSVASKAMAKDDRGMRAPMPGIRATDKSTSIPGEWSPPLKSPRERRRVPKQQEAKGPTLGSAAPTSTVPKTLKVRPGWSSWSASGPPLGDKGSPDQEERTSPATQDEEPTCAIPSALAQRGRVTHRVRTMHGWTYTHKLSTPKYLDTHENPYAIFVFKYRDVAVIERMVGEKVAETEGEEKTRLAGLSKEEIIDELIKAKASKDEDGHALPSADHPVWGPRDDPSAGMNRHSKVKNADSGDSTDNSAASTKWGNNPQGAGPWQPTEAATGKWRGVGDGARSMSKDPEGNGWGSDDNDEGAEAWANDDDNNVGEGDLGNNDHGHGHANSWGNDMFDEAHDSNGQADNNWSGSHGGAVGGWGGYDNGGGHERNDHTINENGGAWGEDSPGQGDTFGGDAGGGGGRGGNGSLKKEYGRADTTWGASGDGDVGHSW